MNWFFYLPLLLLALPLTLLASVTLRRALFRNCGPLKRQYRGLQLARFLFVVVVAGFFIDGLRRGFNPGRVMALVCFTFIPVMQTVQIRRLRPKALAEAPVRRQAPAAPVFFWQAVGILLPALALMSLGLISILRDRAAVESEARQRTQAIAQQLERTLGLRIASELFFNNSFSYQWSEHLRSRVGGWPGSQHRLDWEQDATNYFRLLSEWKRKFPDQSPEQALPNSFSLTPDGRGNEPWEPARLVPPEWFRELQPEARRAWEALKRAEADNASLAVITNAAAAFLTTGSHPAAAANARFVILRAKMRSLAPAVALPELRRFPWEQRRALSESGVPLDNLLFAEVLRQVRVTGPDEQLWSELADQVQTSPSLLTPLLLSEAGSLVKTNELLRQSVEAWRVLWSAQEKIFDLAEQLRTSGCLQAGTPTTTNVWLTGSGMKWLCILQAGESRTMTRDAKGAPLTYTNTITAVHFYPQPMVARAFAIALKNAGTEWPAYLGASAELEGETLQLGGLLPGGNVTNTLLAEAHGQLSAPSRMLLKEPIPGEKMQMGPEFEGMPSRPRFALRLYLADPAGLFAAYHRRLGFLILLILASAFTTAFGVWTARRAFRRQIFLNEQKSNFVSSVSHELRAPLASVRLMAESLERGKIPEPKKQQEYYRFIVQECRRLSALIENVLDFSRIEQGRKQYEFEPTDLLALTRETVRLMEPGATEKGVELKLETPALPHSTLNTPSGHLELQTPKMECNMDGRAIQQALMNLIDNAIKHSARGQAVVVELKRQVPGSQLRSPAQARVEPPTPGIALSVSDSGPGIPAGEQEKIFERFYRLGSELRRETQGVGIGLSIVKHIVEAHGGRVIVKSEVGQGSRFTMELPDAQPEQTPDSNLCPAS